MAKKMNEEPKVRTRTRTDKSGVVRTKTVTRGKGYRKVEKAYDYPSGVASKLQVKERQRTGMGGKIVTKTGSVYNPNAAPYESMSGSYKYEKVKKGRGEVKKGEPRKTVSYDYEVKYPGAAYGKFSEDIEGYKKSSLKEKGSKGKGKASRMTEYMGVNPETGKKIKDVVTVKSKGKKSIVSRLKKRLKSYEINL